MNGERFYTSFGVIRERKWFILAVIKDIEKETFYGMAELVDRISIDDALELLKANYTDEADIVKLVLSGRITKLADSVHDVEAAGVQRVVVGSPRGGNLYNRFIEYRRGLGWFADPHTYE